MGTAMVMANWGRGAEWHFWSNPNRLHSILLRGPLMNLTFAILNPDNVCNIIFYDNLRGGELTEALNLGVNGVDLHSEWFQYDQFITFGTAQEFELQVLIECQPPASDIWIDLISLNPADY
jgi:hypothetical protein